MRVQGAEGRWDEAEITLLKVLEQDPQMTGVYELLGQGFVGRGPTAQNMARLDEFVAKRSDDMQAVLMAGQVFTHLKQPAKARDVYEGFLGKRPESPAVLNNLAVLFAEQLDNSDRALELARKAGRWLAKSRNRRYLGLDFVWTKGVRGSHDALQGSGRAGAKKR